MENPFSLKVGQVFTGIGAGCGVGIGVGQPIPFGSIPALQQVLSATRGATDPFIGVTRYFNSYMKRLGLKHIEAGVGCGVGVGHGFGVGLALKPRVINQIRSSVGEAVDKIMTKLGITPSSSSIQSGLPRPLPSSNGMLTETHGRSALTSTNSFVDRLSDITGSTIQHSTTSQSVSRKPMQNDASTESISWKPMQNHASMESPSDMSLGTSSEKVIDMFLKNPLFNNKEELELNELAGNLRSENNLLQVLLRHQQAIEELVEENQKLRQVMVEDLKVSASKLQAKNENKTKFIISPCSDCFECRRRNRKSGR